MSTWASFSVDKAVGAWLWPLTSIQCGATSPLPHTSPCRSVEWSELRALCLPHSEPPSEVGIKWKRNPRTRRPQWSWALKARNVFFAYSNIGILSSDPTRRTDALWFLRVFVLSCGCRGLATSWSLIQRVLSTVYKIHIFTILNWNRPESVIRHGRGRSLTGERVQ